MGIFYDIPNYTRHNWFKIFTPPSAMVPTPRGIVAQNALGDSKSNNNEAGFGSDHDGLGDR